MVDANSAVRCIKAELEKESVRKWINGDVNVQLLRKYRDWKQHISAHTPVHLVLQFRFVNFLGLLIKQNGVGMCWSYR